MSIETKAMADRILDATAMTRGLNAWTVSQPRAASKVRKEKE